MTPEQAAKAATAPLVGAIEKARAGRHVILAEYNRDMVGHLAPDAVHSARCATFPGGGRITYSIEAVAHVDLCGNVMADRISDALDIAGQYGQIQGDHHRAWVIDQMCRTLLGPDYAAFVAEHKAGEDGPDTYDWDEGIAP